MLLLYLTLLNCILLFSIVLQVHLAVSRMTWTHPWALSQKIVHRLSYWETSTSHLRVTSPPVLPHSSSPLPSPCPHLLPLTNLVTSSTFCSPGPAPLPNSLAECSMCLITTLFPSPSPTHSSNNLPTVVNLHTLFLSSLLPSLHSRPLPLSLNCLVMLLPLPLMRPSPSLLTHFALLSPNQHDHHLPAYGWQNLSAQVEPRWEKIQILSWPDNLSHPADIFHLCHYIR